MTPALRKALRVNWNAQAPAGETDRMRSISLSTWLARVSKAQGKADECVGPVGVPGAEEPGWMHLPGRSWERSGEAANVLEMPSLARDPSGSWELPVV